MTRFFPIICRLSSGAAHDMAAIEAVSNRPPWPAELFATEFNHSYSHTFGARFNGELIAFLVSHFVLDEVHVLNFGVRPDLRGRGVGEALLKHTLHHFFEKSARWVTLEVRRTNEPAKALYEKLGFFEVGVRERYYTDDGEDGIVLRLDLASFVKAHPAE